VLTLFFIRETWLRGQSQISIVDDITYDYDSKTYTSTFSSSALSILAEISSCDIDVGMTMPDGTKHTLSALGEQIKFGVENVQASATFEASYDEHGSFITNVVIQIDINFVGNGTGKISIDGERISETEIGGSFNKLFASIWSDTNKALVQNYLKCALNIRNKVGNEMNQNLCGNL